MDQNTTNLASSVLGAIPVVGGIAQGVLGVASYFANKDAASKMPKYNTSLPGSLLFANQLAKEKINQGMPGYDIAKENVASQNAQANNAAAETGGLNAIGASAQNQRGAYAALNQLAVQNAQYKSQNQQNAISQFNTSANFEQQNKNMGYENTMKQWDLNRMNTQNLMSNLGTAINSGATSMVNQQGQAAYLAALGKMNPWNNSQGLQNAPVSLNGLGIPQGQSQSDPTLSPLIPRLFNFDPYLSHYIGRNGMLIPKNSNYGS